MPGVFVCRAVPHDGTARLREDERHFLYREYLKIILDHTSPVFVMESVKGLLSATVKCVPVIGRILRDLANPRAALQGGDNGLKPGEEVDPGLFVVRAEDFGVPQARHRIFIVGVRSDLKVRPGLLRPHKVLP